MSSDLSMLSLTNTTSIHVGRQLMTLTPTTFSAYIPAELTLSTVCIIHACRLLDETLCYLLKCLCIISKVLTFC